MGSYWCSWWRCGCWYQQNQQCQEVAKEKAAITHREKWDLWTGIWFLVEFLKHGLVWHCTWPSSSGTGEICSDSAGSYWANKAASHWPCTADPKLCEVRESFESGRCGKRCLLLLPGWRSVWMLPRMQWWQGGVMHTEMILLPFTMFFPCFLKDYFRIYFLK